jgi:hypothetical protein
MLSKQSKELICTTSTTEEICLDTMTTNSKTKTRSSNLEDKG